MASKKRSGLGRGIGALIPQVPAAQARPVDVFFPATTTGAPGTAPGAVPGSVFAAATAQTADAGSQTQAEAAQSHKKAKNGVAQATKNAKIAAAGTTLAGAANDITQQLKTPQTAAQEADFSASTASNDTTAATETQLQQIPGAVLAQLRLQDIIPNRVNPRKEFEQEALAELTHSIKEFGVFQPIVVREIAPQPEGQRYEIIMGERRFRASQLAGLETVPAIIRSTADEDMLRDALLENLHRADLNPLEEASAYQQLMEDFAITQEQLAAKIGRSRSQISNTIRLLKLPERVQLRVAAGVLSAGHARAILAVGDNPEAMEQFADRIINTAMTVREAEAAAKTVTAAKPRQAPRPGGRRVMLDEIAERLESRFDTRVNLKLGAKKGQLVFEFATIADLNRILAELGDQGFGDVKP